MLSVTVNFLVSFFVVFFAELIVDIENLNMN